MDQTPPWLIVHRAGAGRRRLAAARASPADRVELDLRWQAGRPEVRHDPLVWQRLPWLTRGRFSLRLRLRPMWLPDVEAPASRIFFDLKEPAAALAQAALRWAAGQAGPGPVAVSTPHWATLERVAAWAPEALRFYSIGRPRRDAEARWRAFEARRGSGGDVGAGVSLHKTLATPERLGRLRAAGLRALCYAVNNEAEGVRLVEWGAGGLISDRLDLIAAWRDRWGR